MTLEGDNFVRIRHEPVTWSSTGQGPYRGVRMNLPRLRAHLSVTAKGSPGLGSDSVCYYLAVLLIKRASEGMGKCGKLAALSEAPSLMRNLLPGSPTPVFSFVLCTSEVRHPRCGFWSSLLPVQGCRVF